MGGPCPSGSYCPIGTANPILCPAGSFNSNTGSETSDDCVPCSPGKFCEVPGLSLPTGDCWPGFFCDGGAITPTQTETLAGYYSIAGAANPSPCHPGMYNAQFGQSECISCPERYYCENSATIEPLSCPEGRFCPLGTSSPSRCPSGTFSNEKGLESESECIPCTAGYFCASNGLTSPTGKCLVGFYCSGGSYLANPNGETFGSVCEEGTYCPEGSTFALSCPLGTYLPSKQAQKVEDCLQCPEGHFCNEIGLAEPKGKCDAGYFCVGGALSKNPIDGSTGDACPIGHFCVEGSVVPEVCHPGTFSDSIGLGSCKICPERFYCDGSDATKYEICPKGFYCIEGTTTPIPCDVGTYSNTSGLKDQEECLTCPDGRYCASSGLVSPTGLCAAGFFCPIGSINAYGESSYSSSKFCPRGFYCEAGISIPVGCPIGTYSNMLQATSVESCILCDEGKYCDGIAMTTPTGLCEQGYVCKRGNTKKDPQDRKSVV